MHDNGILVRVRVFAVDYSAVPQQEARRVLGARQQDVLAAAATHPRLRHRVQVRSVFCCVRVRCVVWCSFDCVQSIVRCASASCSVMWYDYSTERALFTDCVRQLKRVF